MAYYDFFSDRDAGYNNMRYQPYDDERETYFRQSPFYAPPAVMRRRQYEPYVDNYRRNYHQGVGSPGGRYGVFPQEEMMRRVDVPQWMDDSYRHRGHRGGYRIDRRDLHGGQVGGYRVNRRDFHSGPDYGHGHVLDLEDGYDRRGRHSSRREVELYVPLCCDKCERKLRKHLQYLEGVESVTADQTSKRVVVVGNVNPATVLNRARLDKPESDFWHPRYDMYS